MKKAFAAAAGVVIVAGGGLTVPGIAQAATAPSEVTVVPAPAYPNDTADYQRDLPVFAGTTGFLHRRMSSTPWLWTRYADRVTTVVDALDGVGAGSITGMGGDVIGVGTSTPGHPSSGTTRQTLDLGTMTWRAVTKPNDRQYFRLIGDSLLLVAIYEAELQRTAADGTTTTTPVTGVPEGTSNITIEAGDDTHAVLRFGGSFGTRYGLLDASTGRTELMPAAGAASRVVLTEDRVGLLLPAAAKTFSRSALTDEPDTITLPDGYYTHRAGLAGRDVVVQNPSPTRDGLWRFTRDNTTPAKVAEANEEIVQAPEGVLFVGGSGPADWAVRRADADGQPVVLSLTGPRINAGVTLSSGMLRRVTARHRPGEATEYRLSAHQFAAGPGSPAAPEHALHDPIPCQTGETCVRTVDGFATGTSYMRADPSEVSLMTSTESTSHITATPLPSTGGTVVDASNRFRIVNGTGPDRQYVVRYDGTVLSTGPVTGAALWFDTLWTATGAGTIQGKDLDSGLAGTTVSTGSDCTATEVQATARHLYWTCGASGPAGVYDKVGGRNIPVPAGLHLLGDNFLARHEDNGALVRHDLTEGTLGDAVTMATFPRGELTDDRNIAWAVDKFGGDVAWVDGDSATHIVDPGVTPSAPTALYHYAPTTVTLPDAFSATVRLTRPVDSARLTLTQVRTGTTVTGPASGPTRYETAATWNGSIAGKRAASGTYRWTLSVTADATTTPVANGTVVVCDGMPALHSYDCQGRPSVLALSPSATGLSRWFFTNPPGTSLLPTNHISSWAGPTAVVAFGDISKDYRNDVLVRRSDGSLRVLLSDGGPPNVNSKSLVIPGNWNSYNALIHTGDVSGDGQSDLIARETSTGALYLFTGNGKGGFNAATKIEGGYKGYSRFVGNGDINGDGKADLMLQYDPTSTMYALYGNGDGTFQAGLKVVGTGWLGYNVVVGAGDLNEDGKNDLLLRDAAGNVYRRLGTGTGTFGDRLLVGTGYQSYAGLY
ncbi:VCBS repeat-containing protein [Actinoplanes sp. LDG1-06]|uniref:VCBS repeat-containing protein n=1 Tax=Paractinoplanes ovalisporus TaxID=2810368 RepID=A0ABS2ADS3_9ACTN|nr:VCBS repeat-containing protein [Actinoplanes ovalisporus]MBM2617915.1 VCBS repeat-containing protein [Actinoplanes ovalisporus]